MLNIIEAIEEKLQAQKDDIFIKDLQIKSLKEELEAAKQELKEARKTLEGVK